MEFAPGLHRGDDFHDKERSKIIQQKYVKAHHYLGMIQPNTEESHRKQ